MTNTIKDELLHDHNHDGVYRRDFKMHGVGRHGRTLRLARWRFEVLQLKPDVASNWQELQWANSVLSRSATAHMGFNKAANPDIVGTLKAAVDKINGLSTPPEFLLYNREHQSSLKT